MSDSSRINYTVFVKIVIHPGEVQVNLLKSIITVAMEQVCITQTAYIFVQSPCFVYTLKYDSKGCKCIVK